MDRKQLDFKAAVIGNFLDKLRKKFDELLAKENTEELTKVRKHLQQDLKEYREQGAISVAFIGQYSAGKSTIISALTGKRDIKIDADIATDKTASYNWNGIKLIDTPGLFTDRKDHDEITYDAIAKADLLVFCLTYMLFDSITVENFKKLAYEQGYRWKMMLVVNKMSDEAGEEAEKIANYSQSLAEALKPYDLNEFPVCFIDARDYCDSIDEEDEFLLEVSRFDTFIAALNEFVERRAAIAKFDTHVRSVLGLVEDAQAFFTRDSTQDSTFFELLTRLSRVLQKERQRLQNKVNDITLRMSAAISQVGVSLASKVGSDEDFTKLSEDAESKVGRHYKSAEAELQDAINLSIQRVQSDVKQVLSSALIQNFVACLETNQTISAKNVGASVDTQRLKEQIDALNGIAGKAGTSVVELATRGGWTQTAAQQGFLRSIDVAGSNLHRGVLAVGKFVGFKFKPWQAVGVAKNIGNFAKFLGPAMALAEVAAQAYEIHQEHQREQQMADARREITSQFQSVGKELETQMELQVLEFENQIYGDIEKQISEARSQQEEAIAASSQQMAQLKTIRQDLEKLLQYITLVWTKQKEKSS